MRSAEHHQERKDPGYNEPRKGEDRTMSNDFFGNHPMLGSVFDFDRDGSLDLGEAAFMGAMGAAFIDEAERSVREAERESRSWHDDDDDSEDDDW